MTIHQVIGFLNTPFIMAGDVGITLGGIAGAMIICLTSLFISSAGQRFLKRKFVGHPKINDGMVFAFQRIFHYTAVVLGVVIAAQFIGINLGSLAVAFGFLSVGIGFGLQNITSNFISGLILLFERPIGVGDYIDLDGKVAQVLAINMRSTVVRTFDNVTIIVPNSKLIENNVVNWSMDDPRIRLHCPVGVAYGSNVQLVKQTLLEVAKRHEEVLEVPIPEVRFKEFGDSSLNFDLLVWTARPDNQKVLHSDLNFLIEEAFREKGVKIPFPQRDLHLQMSEAVNVLSKKVDR